VPSRHGQKGGVWRGLLCQWGDHRGRVGLRDPKALRQSGQGTGGGIAEGAQGHQQHGEQDVNPLMRFALAHAEQAPVHHLERIGLEVDQNEEQSIFRSCTPNLRIIRSAQKPAKRLGVLPPHLAIWLKAMPSPASTGAGVHRPKRLPVPLTPLRSILDASGSISCFWTPIGSLWCVDRTHPTGYDGPEIDLGGDI
jgi:hypothetical protein